MAGSDDYYELLGVDEDTEPAQLRRVWRQLALRWHPDRAGAGSTATFQSLSAAYSVLSDPALRAEYDRRRAAQAARAGSARAAPAGRAGSARAAPERPSRAAATAPGGPARPASSTAASGKRAPGVMLSRLSGSLDALLAGGTARRAEPGTIELFLKPEEAEEGGMVTISMRVPIRCPDCAGAGCERCASRGAVREVFSAWLAVRPGVVDGAMLAPSAQLPGVVQPVSFRIRLRS